MADSVIKLRNKTLPGLSRETHNNELRRSLKGLDTQGGTNYAIYEKPTPTPSKGIAILPSPAVGPTGSQKICDGRLTVGGQAIAVSAFRLS